jgi:hypothetical protein
MQVSDPASGELGAFVTDDVLDSTDAHRIVIVADGYHDFAANLA